MNRILLAIATFVSVACGQTPGGTIDGQPIPARVFASPQECAQIKVAMRRTAEDNVIRDNGLTITPEDLEKAKGMVQKPDYKAQSDFLIGRSRLAIAALSAVDSGQDPLQVYTTLLQPKGVPPAEWDSYQRRWKTPSQRAAMEQMLSATPEVLAQRAAAYDWTPMARSQKLAAFVDGQLAAADPQFRAYLQHWNQSHSGPDVEHQYLDTQREAFWRDRESKLNVVLNDPALHDKCGLAGIGVQ